MKRYICSYRWGFVESDEILPDCDYYAETKIVDPHELGRLKRCSMGSKTENLVLGNIFNDNLIFRNNPTR